MKGLEFVGIKLVLTERAFRISETTGERVPALFPPGVDEGDLEPGLVFSLDAEDFELAIHPEDWIASGAVEFLPPELEPENLTASPTRPVPMRRGPARLPEQGADDDP
jgi:hypothetical protein